MTEEDLIQNPQFCKLLATLAQHVDQTGLTAPLKTELDKVSVVPVPICSYLFLSTQKLISVEFKKKFKLGHGAVFLVFFLSCTIQK